MHCWVLVHRGRCSNNWGLYCPKLFTCFSATTFQEQCFHSALPEVKLQFEGSHYSRAALNRGNTVLFRRAIGVWPVRLKKFTYITIYLISSVYVRRYKPYTYEAVYLSKHKHMTRISPFESVSVRVLSLVIDKQVSTCFLFIRSPWSVTRGPVLSMHWKECRRLPQVSFSTRYYNSQMSLTILGFFPRTCGTITY